MDICYICTADLAVELCPQVIDLLLLADLVIKVAVDSSKVICYVGRTNLIINSTAAIA